MIALVHATDLRAGRSLTFSGLAGNDREVGDSDSFHNQGASLTMPRHSPDTAGVATPARIHVPDALGTNRYLRSTWHPERQVTTISIWSDNVCLAATNLEAHELPLLISHYATALDDAASSFLPAPFDWTTSPSAPGRHPLFAALTRHARSATSSRPPS